MASLKRPSSPNIDKITHHSIDLIWADDLRLAREFHDDVNIYVIVQELDSKTTGWGTVYTGYAGSRTIVGLEECSEYTYRIRFANNETRSEWSPHTKVVTIREPLSGAHLHRAVNRNNAEDVKNIISTGQVNVNVFDKFGLSPLMQASIKGYTEIAKLLIANYADVDLQNESGKTALMLACFSKHQNIVEILCENGASYNAQDRGGSCAVHYAVDGGDARLLQYILEDGAPIGKRDFCAGWTPLHRCAALSGNSSIAHVLLSNGAVIDAKDNDNKTPLMIAVLNNHALLTDVLLKWGADPNIMSSSGKTPHDLVGTADRKKIALIFEKRLSHAKKHQKVL